jgi:hypothetical protein
MADRGTSPTPSPMALPPSLPPRPCVRLHLNQRITSSPLMPLSATGVIGGNGYPGITIGKGVVSGTYIAKGGGGTARYRCV